MRWSLVIILISIGAHSSMGQRTVGLFLNAPESFNGYTLFAPTGYEHTYLVDNCGQVVNEWTSDFAPGQTAYLLESGHLLRAARISSAFNAGGAGGRIEMFNWENEMTWRINYANQNHHQHHDIEPLPNGNVLLIAWERKSFEEAAAAGRDPDLLTSGGVWPERIVEIRPIGEDDFETVWEWHLWDHLIQDYDSTRANYGVVTDHPELVNLNFIGDNGFGADWIHLNSIDYNATLDQILVSSRHLNEIWIIDHSTTTEEAAGHSGGNSGKGGDILYRWGNPRTYNHGGDNDQTLFGQHSAQWIPEGLPGAGQVMVYNNGFGRPGGTYSSIDVLEPPMDTAANYIMAPGFPFGPDSLDWTYDGLPSNTFFSSRISSGQRLPNGNTLICVGTRGTFFEVDTTGQTVWHYQNPVGLEGPVEQGEIPVLDDVFHVQRYAPDYPGLSGRDLEPNGPVELAPFPDSCAIYGDSTTSSAIPVKLAGIQVFPNPAGATTTITNPANAFDEVRILTISGDVVLQAKLTNPHMTIVTKSWPQGLYLVHFLNKDKHTTAKLIKQ